MYFLILLLVSLLYFYLNSLFYINKKQIFIKINVLNKLNGNLLIKNNKNIY